ncbi:MAG: hypothetical protein II723_07115, partial [Oscillospiraceae bacterium]|nr:hypothetical protein [Oscillospiraceae bacterium]
MKNDSGPKRQEMWSETKRPDAAMLPQENELKFVDPLESGYEQPNEDAAVKIGIYSAVMGVTSVLTSVIPKLGIPLAVIAILSGVFAYGRTENRKMAKIGILTGIIGAVIGIGILLFPMLLKLFQGVAGERLKEPVE